MQKDKKATTVIFRRFKDGEVIAIFPYLNPRKAFRYGSNAAMMCESYMHTGQHGECDVVALTNSLRLAEPSEYADLQKELEGIGYNLDIRKRVNWKRYNEAIRGSAV